MGSPSSHLSPLWKHFRHLGRVQEDYLLGLILRKIDFDVNQGTFSGDPTRERLQDYLSSLDRRMYERISDLEKNSTFEVDWFGEQKSVGQHLMYLSDHEVLHHGQFVVYQKLQGWQFPKSWATWGL